MNKEKLIFKGIVGSTAFGTNTPESDLDYASIFMCDNNDLLGLEYKEHDDVNKDDRRYELNKFVKLLMLGNPNMIEILNLPSDCWLEWDSKRWTLLQKHKDIFLTKKLGDTFSGYAKTQLEKAQGLNKKINWEKNKIDRKDVLDFCYFEVNGRSMSVKDYLKTEGISQEQIGLVKLDKMRDAYAAYFDTGFYEDFEAKGIVKHLEVNDVHVSSVPKHMMESPHLVMSFNKDGYCIACYTN